MIKCYILPVHAKKLIEGGGMEVWLHAVVVSPLDPGVSVQPRTVATFFTMKPPLSRHCIEACGYRESV